MFIKMMEEAGLVGNNQDNNIRQISATEFDIIYKQHASKK